MSYLYNNINASNTNISSSFEVFSPFEPFVMNRAEFRLMRKAIDENNISLYDAMKTHEERSEKPYEFFFSSRISHFFIDNVIDFIFFENARISLFSYFFDNFDPEYEYDVNLSLDEDMHQTLFNFLEYWTDDVHSRLFERCEEVYGEEFEEHLIDLEASLRHGEYAPLDLSNSLMDLDDLLFELEEESARKGKDKGFFDVDLEDEYFPFFLAVEPNDNLRKGVYSYSAVAYYDVPLFAQNSVGDLVFSNTMDYFGFRSFMKEFAFFFDTGIFGEQFDLLDNLSKELAVYDHFFNYFYSCETSFFDADSFEDFNIFDSFEFHKHHDDFRFLFSSYGARISKSVQAEFYNFFFENIYSSLEPVSASFQTVPSLYRTFYSSIKHLTDSMGYGWDPTSTGGYGRIDRTFQYFPLMNYVTSFYYVNCFLMEESLANGDDSFIGEENLLEEIDDWFNDSFMKSIQEQEVNRSSFYFNLPNEVLMMHYRRSAESYDLLVDQMALLLPFMYSIGFNTGGAHTSGEFSYEHNDPHHFNVRAAAEFIEIDSNGNVYTLMDLCNTNEDELESNPIDYENVPGGVHSTVDLLDSITVGIHRDPGLFDYLLDIATLSEYFDLRYASEGRALREYFEKLVAHNDIRARLGIATMDALPEEYMPDSEFYGGPKDFSLLSTLVLADESLHRRFKAQGIHTVDDLNAFFRDVHEFLNSKATTIEDIFLSDNMNYPFYTLDRGEDLYNMLDLPDNTFAYPGTRHALNFDRRIMTSLADICAPCAQAFWSGNFMFGLGAMMHQSDVYNSISSFGLSDKMIRPLFATSLSMLPGGVFYDFEESEFIGFDHYCGMLLPYHGRCFQNLVLNNTGSHFGHTQEDVIDLFYLTGGNVISIFSVIGLESMAFVSDVFRSSKSDLRVSDGFEGAPVSVPSTNDSIFETIFISDYSIVSVDSMFSRYSNKFYSMFPGAVSSSGYDASGLSFSSSFFLYDFLYGYFNIACSFVYVDHTIFSSAFSSLYYYFIIMAAYVGPMTSIDFTLISIMIYFSILQIFYVSFCSFSIIGLAHYKLFQFCLSWLNVS